MRNKNAECRNKYDLRAGGWFLKAGGLLAAPTVIALFAVLLLCMGGCLRLALRITGECEGYFASSGMSLEEAVARAKPRAEKFDVLLMGYDGMIARVSGEELDGCELVYSRENLWEIKSEPHPPSARVKGLARIAIVGEGEPVGQLLLDDALYLLKEEGTSRKNGRGVTVYTTRLRVPAAPVERIDDLPELMITQTYTDAMEALKRDERVMIIELDGLGWEMLERADAPFLKSLGPERALVCWPPISPTGLASMLTGVTADGHGVRDRESREMACEDIFAKAQAMGKACAYIEGSHALLGTSLRPVLSLGDEAVYENARKALAGEPDLLFVHFHEIDETAHGYGPYAQETLLKIGEIDGHVRALCEGFGGRVIITADHGLHETQEGGGDHGEYRAEDMAVPYIMK